MSRLSLLATTVFAALLLTGCGKQSQDESASTEAADSTEVQATDQTAPPRTEPEAEPADTTVTNQQSEAMSAETNYYEITTPEGRMVVRLYDRTPVHRDNFRKLVADGYYDGTTFHRVIEGFMIQGGDGLSKDDDPLNDGMGEIGYTLNAEIRDDLFHKKGALAAARQGDQVNPERRSSGSQFYIVQGTVVTDEQLDDLEQQMKMRVSGFTISDAAREAYKTVGGTPFLDGQYTVFGELVEGFDVLDSIAATQTPRKTGERVNPQLADRPPEPIRMEVRPLPDYPS